MPERIETYYICHCCGSESQNKSFILKVIVPARLYDRTGEKYHKSINEIDLCAECFERFWTLCDEQFATVEVSDFGKEVIPHFTDDERSNND